MSKFKLSELNYYLELAIEQARIAAAQDEVPVGAIVVKDNKVIGSGFNLVNQTNDLTKHAEIVAIQNAANFLGDWRLTDCSLFVTLEPCTMCIGAIRAARINTLVFGASDLRMGACGSIYDLAIDARLGLVPRVVSGIKEQECSDLLSSFFKQKR